MFYFRKRNIPVMNPNICFHIIILFYFKLIMLVINNIKGFHYEHLFILRKQSYLSTSTIERKLTIFANVIIQEFFIWERKMSLESHWRSACFHRHHTKERVFQEAFCFHGALLIWLVWDIWIRATGQRILPAEDMAMH